MSQWSFVTAAYVVAIVATLGLLVWACMSMRKAEAAADELKRK